MDKGNIMIEQLVGQYTRERIGGGHITEATARNIHYQLGLMARHVGPTAPEVTTTQLRMWVTSNDSTDGAVKPRTVALRVTRAKHFFEWCVEIGVIDKNPARALHAPKIRATEPRFFEHDEVRRLCAVVDSARDLAMILLMVQMGLRRIEIHRALVSDVSFDKGRMAVRGKGYRAEVSRYVPIPREAATALEAWLSSKPQSPHLFCTRSGAPLDVGYISRQCSALMRKAGIKASSGDGKSAHALRHTFAQSLVDDGVPLRVVQAAMGHQSVTTTEAYARRQVDVLAEALEGRTYVA